MATQLYLRSVGSTTTFAPLWPTASEVPWSAFTTGRQVSPGGAAAIGFTRANGLIPTISTGVTGGQTNNSVAGPAVPQYWTETLVGTATNVHFLSAPLAADVTISGTVSFAMCGFENSMSANLGPRVFIYRVDETGQMASLIIDSDSATEWGTSSTKTSWTGTPTSTNMKKGDRIMVVPTFDDEGGTMASGFSAAFLFDRTAATTGDSNVSFTETITFITSDPSGTTYFLRNTSASGISGGKAMSTSAGSSSTTAANYSTVAGPLTYPGQQWTLTAGGSVAEWYTPSLLSFTLGGAVKFHLGGTGTRIVSQHNGGTAPHTNVVSEIAVCDSTGGLKSVWARGYNIDAVATSGTLMTGYITGPDLVTTDADRLRFRLYSIDYLGQTQSTGTTQSFNYDGASGGGFDAKLIFTQTITEGTGSGGGNALPKPIRRTLLESRQRASLW